MRWYWFNIHRLPDGDDAERARYIDNVTVQAIRAKQLRSDMEVLFETEAIYVRGNDNITQIFIRADLLT